MPRIPEFFGIVIYRYFANTSRHAAPHFHAKYGEHEGVYPIPDADLLAGSLPKHKSIWFKVGRPCVPANWNKHGSAL